MSSYPRHYLDKFPDKIAVTMADGSASLSYAELEEQANQVAHLFRSLGIQTGERVAFVLDNCIDVFTFSWGAQRAGLFFVAIPSGLTAKEVQYIVEDSGSKSLLIFDHPDAGFLQNLAETMPAIFCYKLGAATKDWKSWGDAVSGFPVAPIADEACGTDMLYSSGTTGKPKAVVPTVDVNAACDAPYIGTPLFQHIFSLTEDSIYLSPAPLYHAAPLRWCLAVQRLGGTVVVMKKFDAEGTLAAIENFKINVAQFVPTHFIRMLQLEESVRSAYDIASLKMMMHAAAPCPVPIKYEMLDWFGPIVYEYYGGSEGVGMTLATPEEWLAHPGTVGRAVFGTLRICDDAGEVLAVGEEGSVCFENQSTFEYFNDPEKTAKAFNKQGFGTMGDIGRMDEDGFLYLTDRKSFMIISGGVNIYPQEIENHLLTHPKVLDAAVIGMPHPDFGEKVVAVLQLTDSNDANDDLKIELGAFCRQALSGVKVPRQIDFVEQLPRTETGKLMKRLLQDGYQTIGS